MRKALIVALGLVSFGICTAEPAFAVTKRICQTTYVRAHTPMMPTCDTLEGRTKYHCTTKQVNGFGLQTCFDVEVLLPTTLWKPGVAPSPGANTARRMN